jgi:hypothetical protein
MPTIQFDGTICEEKSPAEWEHWVCPHLKSLLASTTLQSAPRVVRILHGLNKSSEIFVFIAGPLPKEPAIANFTTLAHEPSRISCNACWCALYAAEAL